MLKEIPCVLLAGGKSSRMGQDKCFLPLQNDAFQNENLQPQAFKTPFKTFDFINLDLIHYQFLRLKPYFKDIFISCKEDKFKGEFKLILDANLNLSQNENKTKTAAQKLQNITQNTEQNTAQSLQILSPQNTPQSPLLALYSILNFFKKGLVFVLAVDMPCVSLKDIKRLYQAFNETNSNASLAKTPSHTHFLCGFYEASLSAVALELLRENKHSIKEFATLCSPVFTHFDEANFMNLNDKKDYLNFLKEFSAPSLSTLKAHDLRKSL